MSYVESILLSWMRYPLKPNSHSRLPGTNYLSSNSGYRTDWLPLRFIQLEYTYIDFNTVVGQLVN